MTLNHKITTAYQGTTEKKYEEWKIWYYFLQVCKGVAYMHQLKNGIVHMDIKADNILINNDDKIACVTDYTLSVILEKDGYFDFPEDYPYF